MKSFGQKPKGKRLERIVKSPNFRNGAFQNIQETEVLLKDASYVKMLREFINKPSTTKPSRPIKAVKADLKEYLNYPTVTWLGHSSYLIQSKGFNILVDPVFSGYASPFSFIGHAFKGTDIYKSEDFPEINLLIITHDHYDHLDYKTILQFKDKVKHIVTSLGVGQHLEYWGVDSRKITELDWWEETNIERAHITATPSRHFSGRAFKRGLTLWSSFVLNIDDVKCFIGGDSGYDNQFRVVGEKYGPFDLALLDCAQYGEQWPYIHMKPEQTIQACKDLKAETLLPVHWGKFALSNHPWTEPIERILKAADGIKVTTPQIGERYIVGSAGVKYEWWKFD